MKIISENTSSGIEARSLFSDKPLDVKGKNYDLVVVTSSWDPRCLNITRYNIDPIDNSILILFDDKDAKGEREKNDKVLLDWSKSISSNTYVLNGLSTDVEDVFKQLYIKLASICVEICRPINVLFDLSVCPRYISLSFLSRGFNHSLIKDIDYLYGECKYPEPTHGVIGIEEVIFTSGEWNTIPIDFINGNYNPSTKKIFTVSIGFEGNKTLRVINQEDPDKVRLLVPDPGYDESYVSRVLKANSELIKNEDIADDDKIRAHAGDAIDAWIKLDDANKKQNICEQNQSYLCAGSKPHSLGLALSALANPDISLLYSHPQSHEYIEIDPLNRHWVYNIKSITTPN